MFHHIVVIELSLHDFLNMFGHQFFIVFLSHTKHESVVSPIVLWLHLDKSKVYIKQQLEEVLVGFVNKYNKLFKLHNFKAELNDFKNTFLFEAGSSIYLGYVKLS